MSLRDEEVPNDRSTARDHLANERTLLAWVRTALGVMGLGVILERLIESSVLAMIGAFVLVTYGALLFLYALYRHRRITNCLKKGTFPIANDGALILGGLAIVLTIGAVVFVVSH